MVRSPAGLDPQFILSKEGVTQGCPLGMLLYGVSLLGLGEELRKLTLGVLQPWYADDFSMFGKASKVAQVFQVLCKRAPVSSISPHQQSLGPSAPNELKLWQSPSWMPQDYPSTGVGDNVILVASLDLTR